MKILFYLHHPAQFFLFKNVINELKNNNHNVIIFATKKDILADLLKSFNIKFINNLPFGRKDKRISMALGVLKQDFGLLMYCFKNRPDIMVGTSAEICHIGKILRVPSIFVNEDDVEVVALVGKIAYPFANYIVAPRVCSTGKWNYKTIRYDGYHELAYLHPNHFVPKKEIVNKYFSANEPFFIIRLAKLTAHHDKEVNGLSYQITKELIEILEPFGKIYITSEKKLNSSFQKYQLNINIQDIHHVLYYAKLFIGDSQTMAAEAGVLGTPFIRYNDFVGRIGYLNELENKYHLGFGFSTDEPKKMLEKVKKLVKNPDTQKIFRERKAKMLKEKIDFSIFLYDLISGYPNSLKSNKVRRNSSNV